MVVNTTPPEETASLRRRSALVLSLNRRLPQQISATGKSAEELIVKFFAVGQNDDSGFSIAGSRMMGPLLVNNANRHALSAETAPQLRFRLSGSCPSSAGMGIDVLPKSSRSLSKAGFPL